MKKVTLKKGDKAHLSDLKIGQKAKVLGIHMDKPDIRRHLLDMGITRGTEILIKKVAPMGDPVDIELRGYELCIRKSDMKNIDIVVVE
jgi:Fe2+ transport system protein FeoA